MTDNLATKGAWASASEALDTLVQSAGIHLDSGTNEDLPDLDSLDTGLREAQAVMTLLHGLTARGYPPGLKTLASLEALTRGTLSSINAIQRVDLDLMRHLNVAEGASVSVDATERVARLLDTALAVSTDLHHSLHSAYEQRLLGGTA